MIKQNPKMASESIPPPPPPPPLLNNDNIDTNGPTTSHVQSPDNGAKTTSTDGTKPWQRAWSVDEMRKGAKNWSLASDAGLLLYLQEFSQNMLSKTHSMEQKVDGLVQETKGISAKVHNTFNNFLMLSNTQFIENRVYDEEETKDEEEKASETVAQEKEKTREELETEVIPKINEAIQSGLAVLDSAFVTVEITPEQVSDDEDEETLPENFKPEPILELTDVYAHRKLPNFIGSHEFQKDDLVGLGESSSEDEGSDKEASVESETEEGTDEDETSESETVSGSESESTEESSTATESDDEKEVVVKKKARKESSQVDSDDELFAAGGTQKTRKSKENEDSDSDESMEDEEEKQPRKSGAPMDFSAELAAKLGVKAKPPVIDSDDDDGDNDQDWGDSGKHESEDAKDDLFSASVDTTSSVVSKSSKKRDKKHKKPKSRSGSHASHDSGKAAGSVTNDIERSQRHADDDEDDLFTSSIDTTASTFSKSSKSKHKHKKKTARSDSQLSNASSKSGQKETKTASNKDEDNLFSASPEGDLFDENSPFGKKGGMFSGGSGLFDDVMEDEDEISSKVNANNPDDVASNISKTSHEKAESDEEVAKPKPRTASGKKLPAGAVAIFGDQGPFGHVPVQTGEHHVAKTVKPEKEESKASAGGGLFSDERDDLFTSSQSSSVVSSKPPAVAPKAAKSVDLFGSEEDEGDDDDSLFGAKAPKKTGRKAEPPKKKLPAGAVSIFGGGLPPPLFSASKTESPESPPAVAPASNSNSKKEASGLFDEDNDLTNSINAKQSAVSSTAPPAALPKRKTNQISLFDDNDDAEDGDGDDLFSSIAPSKKLGSAENKTVSKPGLSTDAKASVSKPAPKRSTISLFDDDDDEDDQEEDIFSIKPSTKSNQPEVKPPAKKSTVSAGLFASEEDPLFSGPKPNDISDGITVDSKKQDVKTTEQESAVRNVDEDDDLFDEPMVTPTISEPPKKEVEKQTEDLFDADDDDKDEADGVKPGRKILPGAVPMFGGVDIFAGQKPGKNTKAKLQADSLFGDDEDDLFSTLPKPVPTVAPRAKPRKTAVEAPATASSPLEESTEAKQAPPAASSSNRNTNVGKLQKTLAFNPAAMLPGAAPPPKRNVATTETVEQNQKRIMFNPATMLPGAVPPPRKQENVAEATFDKPASLKTLETSGRDRARVRGKRRPPTRQARQKAAKESMDDTSLFGSSLTAPSNDALPGNKGAQSSLFDDSSDLFSSSSYRAPKQKNLTSHTTQSHAGKFDPLFLHNAMASDLPSFEDSIDGISSDARNDKTERPNTEGRTDKSDSIFNTPPKDDLFSISTESESSFLPKSDTKNRSSNQQETEHKPKTLFDESPTDDLFSISSENKSSTLQKVEGIPAIAPKANNKTKSSSVLDKKANDDLLNQSIESNASQKEKPKQKSEIDSLFDTKPKDDLFNQSRSDILPTVKPREDVSAKKGQNSKSDSLFDRLPPEDDIFSKSTATESSRMAAPNETLSAKKNRTDEDDLLFDNKPKDDLFKISVDSNVSQQAKLDDSKTGPIFDSNPKDDVFKKSSSQKVKVIENDDDDDEDDLFKPSSKPLFSPPPLESDSEVTASGEFSAQSKSKPVSDDIFNDDDDIFAPKSSQKKNDEIKNELEKPTLENVNDNEENKEKPKQSEVKTSDEVDLFADTGSIFDDLPKKSKEKKKKKATSSKEENIFDDKKDSATGSEDAPSKTAKKTRGKKKGKSKMSIFDEDSPSIFDDPLNATSK